MAASQGIFAKGSILQRKNVLTPFAFVAIPQLRIIPVPAATQQYGDMTNHDSDGSFEENLPTIKVGNDLPFVLVYHYNITSHVQLYQDFLDQTKLTWRSLFPGGLIGWEYEARVGSFEMPLDFSAIAFLNGSLKVTGLPVPIDLTPS